MAENTQRVDKNLLSEFNKICNHFRDDLGIKSPYYLYVPPNLMPGQTQLWVRAGQLIIVHTGKVQITELEDGNYQSYIWISPAPPEFWGIKE